jgi:anthranilate phosphoribosyltransferase
VAVDELLTISDPFNGFNRCLPMSPFVPAVLAACGLPSVSTGVETVAPKFGLTHHRLLAAAGKSVSLTARRAAAQLADPKIGWAYLDQSASNPKLFRLRELRRLMVKRTLLSTCEVMLKPLTARRSNLACVGYVHTNYPPVYALLAELAGYDSAIIVKGTEGGVVPSLNTGAKLYHAGAGAAGEPLSVRPDLVGIAAGGPRAVPAPSADLRANAARAVELGLAALNGEPGAARDSLVYAAAIALTRAGKAESFGGGARTARRALDSGEAKSRFEGAG